MESEGRADGLQGFGTLLRRHRLAAGLSQEALAERARMSVEGISALERSFRRTPQRETVALLAGALALDGEQRQAFEEAAAGLPSSRRGVGSVTVGPWPSSSAAILPPALTAFVGREEELVKLGAALSQGNIAAVYGLGGVGKSSVAREYAWRSRGQYSVTCWLNAQTEDSIIDGLIGLGVTFVNDLDQRADRRAAARHVVDTLLSGFDKPVLLVFDNLEEERHLRAWLPRTGARALVTSRNAAWGAHITAIPLHVWSIETGADYLQRESRRNDLTDVDGHAIVEALGGLPLALAHAAASLSGMRMLTPGRYLEHIGAHLSKAPYGVEYPQSVFATFKATIAQAEHEAAGAAATLCLAASFAPDDIPDELFRQPLENYVAGSPPVLSQETALDLHSVVADDVRLDEALGALDRLSLLVFSEGARTYRIHRLVQLASLDLVAAAAQAWRECAAAVVNAAFPGPEFAEWSQCARLLPHARVAVDALPSDTGFLPAGRLAHRCAVYLKERAEYGAAKVLQTRAHAIQEKALGPDHPEVAACLNQLALLYWGQSRDCGEAEVLYMRALATWEKSLGPDHPCVAIGLNNLAIVYCDQGRYGEAEQLLARSLAIIEKEMGPDHPKVALALSNLTRVYGEQGRYPEAERQSRRALAIQEKAIRSDHPEFAKCLNNLAEVVRGQGRNKEVELLCTRALAILENALGVGHPEIGHVLNNLAKAYSAEGRGAEAERLLLRALEIREKSLAPDHPHIAASLCDLADLYDEQGRDQGAKPLYARALAIREGALGPEHPETKKAREKLKNLESR
jgi:tetratricopeptide (TPR) repeat protein/transcriptional regulator with XRE-family HTH domain